jgi:hypothetical protein
MYCVMVKHAGSNSDAHAVEFCRVGARDTAERIAATLLKERMKYYALSPKSSKSPKYRSVARYLRAYVEEFPSSPPGPPQT